MKQIIAVFVLFYGVSCAFVIDSSGSMKPNGFDQEKDFVKKAAKELGVAPGKSRAAVIQFALTATEKIGFKEAPALADFERAVDDIKYDTEGRTTHIDNGLSKAKEVSEKVRSSDRIKLLLLLSDGEQSNADEKLKQLSSELRNASIRLLAVGIGSGVNVEQLKLIAGDDANAITATDFNHLKNKLGSLAKKACEPLATKLPGAIETCKDKDPSCQSYGTRPDYCRQHPDDMAVRCPKTCNMCPY